MYRRLNSLKIILAASDNLQNYDLSNVVENSLKVFDAPGTLNAVRLVREYCTQLEDAINTALSSSTKGKGRSSANNPTAYPSSIIQPQFFEPHETIKEAEVPSMDDNMSPRRKSTKIEPRVYNEPEHYHQKSPTKSIANDALFPNQENKSDSKNLKSISSPPRQYTQITPHNFESDKIYIAVKNFIAVNPDQTSQVNLKAGDLLKCSCIMDDFVLGANTTTNVDGIFPLNCIGYVHEAQRDFIEANKPPATPIPEVKVIDKPVGLYVAIAAYKPTNEVEVAMEVGDELEITTWGDENIAMGFHRKSKIQGQFPAHLIKYLGTSRNQPQNFRPGSLHSLYGENQQFSEELTTSSEEIIPPAVPIMSRHDSLIGSKYIAPTTPLISQMVMPNGDQVRIEPIPVERDQILAHIAEYQHDYAVALNLYRDQMKELKQEGKEVPLSLNLELMRQLTSNMAEIPRNSLSRGSESNSGPSRVDSLFSFQNQSLLNSPTPTIKIPTTPLAHQNSISNSANSGSPQNLTSPLHHTGTVNTVGDYFDTRANIPPPARFDSIRQHHNSQPSPTNSVSEATTTSPEANPNFNQVIESKSTIISNNPLQREPSTGADLPPPTRPLKTKPTLQQRINKRRGVILELYHTEGNYRDELKVLTDSIMLSILEQNFLSKVQSDRVTKAMKGVGELHSLSVTVYQKLEEATKDKDGNAYQVARIFLEHVDEWNAYIKYVENYSDIHNVVRYLEKSPPPLGTKFHDFQEKLRNRPECGRKDIYHFLIIPIKRIGHYWLLLSTLKKYVEHEVAAAENYMWQIGSLLNQAKKREEQIEKMFEVFNFMKGCPPNILSQSKRQFIKQFDFQNMSGTSLVSHTPPAHGHGSHSKRGASVPTIDEFHLFLFSDCFLIASAYQPKEGKKGKESFVEGGPAYKYLFEKRVAIEGLVVVEKSDDEETVVRMKYRQDTANPDGQFIFKMQSVAEKLELCDTILAASQDGFKA
ncbi:hypothetical protein HK098_006107 [Nowakowskiella sp. JEL0407]|nr:hypothetical protein HK098_006107 [Nowakowskiella sp. JEL0407]